MPVRKAEEGGRPALVAMKAVVNPAHAGHLYLQARLRKGRGSGIDMGKLNRSPK